MSIVWNALRRTVRKAIRWTQYRNFPAPCFRECEDLPYQPKTGILIIHPGEPKTDCGAEAFLKCIEKDKNFTYTMQSIWGGGCSLISPEELKNIYQIVGCYSPLLKCATRLGIQLEKLLDRENPLFAPHRSIVGFRYTKPFISKALKQFEMHRIKNLVILALEPHFCYQRTAPCFDAISRYYRDRPLPDWSWTIIDRWPLNYLYCGAMAQRVQVELDSMPKKRRRDAVMVFVANNIPTPNIRYGELYPYEIGVDVQTTMRMMGYSHQHVLGWLPGRNCDSPICPTLDETVKGLLKHGAKEFVLIPITCPCINLDTLFAIDVCHVYKYREEFGPDYYVLRADHPNYHRFLVESLARIVKTALNSKRRATPQFLTPCHANKQQCCVEFTNFFTCVIERQCQYCK